MNPKKRHKARRYALQALYQWHIGGAEITDIRLQFHDNMRNDEVDQVYFNRLFMGVTTEKTTVDQCLARCLDRDLSDLTPIELNLLRIASYELIHCLEVPYKVVLNEALEIAKVFGTTDDGFKYVNAVLDNVARRVRPNEIIT